MRLELPTQSRPLSPHLSIYRFTITMAISIVHRATGIGLYAGMLLLALWFVATWALFHHLLGGIRHFIFDTGRGFDRQTRFGLAWGNLVGGIVLTIVVWAAFVWF